MPRFDGTGPLGKGPFTGRGRGYCVEPVDSKEIESTTKEATSGLQKTSNVVYGRGQGGLGRGMGFGRGRRHR